MPAARRRTAVVLLFLALLLTVLPARADIGPKRSISIRFEDLPAGTVYAAILPETQYAYDYPDYMNHLTRGQVLRPGFRRICVYGSDA